MNRRMLATLCCLLLAWMMAAQQRTETLLEKNWRFTKGDVADAMKPEFDDTKWETVTVPHDWAIYGPFDRSHDLQNVAVTQNLETTASVKTGRTGGLPYVGVGWYRTTFDAPAGKQVSLVFDGAMSEARVYVNGQEACFWPCGYNSFHCDVTPYSAERIGCAVGEPSPVFPLVSGCGLVQKRACRSHGSSACTRVGHPAHHAPRSRRLCLRLPQDYRRGSRPAGCAHRHRNPLARRAARDKWWP